MINIRNIHANFYGLHHFKLSMIWRVSIDKTSSAKILQWFNLPSGMTIITSALPWWICWIVYTTKESSLCILALSCLHNGPWSLEFIRHPQSMQFVYKCLTRIKTFHTLKILNIFCMPLSEKVQLELIAVLVAWNSKWNFKATSQLHVKYNFLMVGMSPCRAVYTISVQCNNMYCENFSSGH